MKTTLYPKIIFTFFAMLLIAMNVFPQASPPTTIIPTLTCQEGTFNVPVTVNNFNGVGNISLKLNYDPASLTFQSVSVNPAIPSGNLYTTIAPDVTGQFRLSYTGANGAPSITLPNGTILFTLTFAVNAGVTSVVTPITWSPLQGDCEYSPPAPGVFNPVNTVANFSTYFTNGSVAIKPIPVITGPNSVCPGSTGNIYTTQAGMSNYVWNVSAGGIITSGALTNTITVTWPASAGSHSVSVNYTDPAVGCSATTPTVYPVNVTSLITPTLTGPNSVCVGTSGMTYTTEPGMSNYQWSIIGGTITSGGTGTSNTAIVTWNTPGPQSITVDYTPSGGCAHAPTVYPVNITPTVGIPTITAGVEPTCQLTNATTTTTYSASATNSTGFNWSISNPAAGSIDPSTGVMTWTIGFSGTVNIQVTANGCNGPSQQVIRTVTITPSVGTPTAIIVSAGTEPTCQLTNANTTTTYSTTATNSNGCSWSISNLAAGSIDPSTGVMTWANGFTGTVNIQVRAIGCNGPSAQVIRTVTITPSAGIPTAITISSGLEPTCELTLATTTTTYSTTATNSTGFNWSISNPAAGNINPTTGVMTWAIGFSGSVNIQVTANGCNGPSAQTIRTVTLTPGVGTPTAITISAGTEPTCQLANSTTSTTYSTTALNSFSFSWSVSNPAAGTINPITGEMIWANGFAGSVDIQVKANGCSGASAQVVRTVIVSPNVGTPAPITISAGTEPTCQLTNATTTTTYTTTATGSTGFVWSISNPAAGTIDPSGVMTWANGFSGSVDIRVIANGCNGPSNQITRNVVVTPTVGTPTPITVLSGTEPSCQLTEVTNITTYATTATNNTGLIWSISNPAAGTINPITGAMLWNHGFSGSVDIQVIANGCNGPSAQVVRTVVITPTVGTPTAITVSAGTEPTCQIVNATTTTYATTAANSTGFNWSISNPLAGSIDPLTGVMTWAIGFSGSVNIQVTANGCNGISAQVIREVTIQPSPLPTITGSTTVCTNSTGNVYVTESGKTSYIWSVSAGGTITAGGTQNDNTVTITWNTPGNQTVSVNYSNRNGCTTITPTVYNVLVNQLPTPTLSGPSVVCLNSTGNVYTTEAGMSNYSWTISAGGTVTTGGTQNDNTVTVNWNTAGPQTVSVNYSNGNGCSATSAIVYPVTVTAPVTPSLVGANSLCIGTTRVYSTEHGMSQYNWIISAGGTIISGGTPIDNTVTVVWNTAGDQSVSVDYIQTGGCPSLSTVRTVTVNPLPAPTITGPGTICVNTTGNVYTTQAGMSNYVWTVSPGGIITAGGTYTSNTITVKWNTAGNQTVSVNYMNGNGCSATSAIVYPVTVNNIVTPTLNGSNSVCTGTSGVIYTTESGMTQYNWIISAGGTITSGGTSTDNTVTVTWNTAGAQSVTVDYISPGGCSSTTTAKPVTVNPLPVPVITGPAAICMNTTGNVYTAQTGMSNYVWNVSAGGTITAGGTSTSNTVTVTWNTAGSQTVSVNYANASGCLSTNPTTYNVTVNTIPDPAGIINGSANVNAGATGITYSVGTIPNATSYVWSLPAGATIVSGDGTNNIKVDFATNAASGNITVYGNNACGAGTSSQPFVVMINQLPAVPGNITGTSTLCQGVTGITYAVPSINFATGYVWTLPSGATIMSGDNTNSITVNYGINAVSGNITVYGTNSSGNGSVSSPLVITVKPLPPTPVITVDAVLQITMTSSSATGNQWYDVNGPIQGAINQTYTATHNGNYYVIVTGECTSAQSNTITITKISVISPEIEKFGAYPNPNTGGFWVEYKSSENEKLKMVQIIDLLGKPVYQIIQTIPTSDYKEWVNFKNHPVGVYILVLTTENRKISRRLIITR